jgi:hypothetical protein
MSEKREKEKAVHGAASAAVHLSSGARIADSIQMRLRLMGKRIKSRQPGTWEAA